MERLSIWFVAAGSAIVLSNPSLAQSNNREGETERSTISVRQVFDPVFRIEPLTQQISGRGGQVIPFTFKIESAQRDTVIEVRPMGLRQQRSGLILNDQANDDGDGIRLVTPQRMTLEANKTGTIEGVIQIPSSNARHHVFGLLVRDLGSQPAGETDDANSGGRTEAQISFVTQYVLRIEVTVEGARNDTADRLVIQDVTVVPVNGRPLLRATVTNPTDATQEFEMRGRMWRSRNDRAPKPVRLVMPVRQSMQSDDRYLAKLLPHATIYMEEMLPQAIASGTYEAELELLAAKRTVVRKSLPVTVNADDFPAQQILVAQTRGGLLISPNQIELSQLRGGNRRVTMQVENHSRQSQRVKLRTLDSSQREADFLIIQPVEFVLAAGAARNVSVILKGQLAPEEPVQYGTLEVAAKESSNEYWETREIPLATIFKPLGRTKIGIDSIVWDQLGTYPSFRTWVENQGNRHLPLDARLTLISDTGQRRQILGGFGKWVMPGRKSELEFRVDQPLVPGAYTMVFELQTGDEPLVLQQNIMISQSVGSTDP